MDKDIKDLTFSDLQNIDTYACLLGLSFPDVATEFQKAALTLAHLMAAVRESVLKGVVIPENVVALICGLSALIGANDGKQK